MEGGQATYTAKLDGPPPRSVALDLMELDSFLTYVCVCMRVLSSHVLILHVTRPPSMQHPNLPTGVQLEQLVRGTGRLCDWGG